MKKFLTFIFTLIATFQPAAVAAYSHENSVSNTAPIAVSAGLGIFILLFILLLFAIAVVSFIWWVLMLIHASQNDIPDKNMWIIILVVSLFVGMPLIGALVYYFVVKRNFTEKVVATKAKSARKAKAAKK